MSVISGIAIRMICSVALDEATAEKKHKEQA
jgi:hypothetical protein